MEDDFYKTIETNSEGFFKDRKSKFYGFAFPVKTEDEIKEIQQELRKKYYDARHHVYAYRLGAYKDVFRASDDGEPSNSSGPPILGQIKSYDLTNILIIVVRYFGGKKLGVPGLINAYRTAADEAIKNNKIIVKTIDDTLDINFGYNQMNFVMNIASEEGVKIIEQDFTATCKIKLSIRKNKTDEVVNQLTKLGIRDFTTS